MAQTGPDRAAMAQGLYDSAAELIKAGKFAEACPKLEESQRLDPGMGTQFRLAECYEAVGRLASAWNDYVQVADLAKYAGQVERERFARERAALVEGRLSRLAITVSSPDVPGLEVRRAGAVVEKSAWGTPVPVDPGSYEVTAEAPGKRPWTGQASVVGEGMVATLVVPSLEDAPAVLPSPSQSVLALPLAPPPAPSARPLRTAGFAVGGAGAVGVVVGGVLGAVAFAKVSSAKSECAPTPGSCAVNTSSTATSDMQTAGAIGNASTALFIAGGALVAGGIVMVVVGGRAKERGALRVTPAVLADGAALVGSGAW